MLKSEPKTILQFLATHFDLLRQLFDIQVEHNIILKTQVSAALKEYESDVENQLLEYKILVEESDDYAINEPYLKLFGFVLQQFKPLLPEEIKKYGQSIRSLFSKIKIDRDQGKNLLLARIEALTNEIKEFIHALKNNTTSLLNKSRELKANPDKIEYPEKVQKARYLVDIYIDPLNKILDVDDTQSIYYELINISKFSNKKRFDPTNESIRIQFEKLHKLLKQVVDDITQQSKRISDELLPLLDRIKTESEYLQGFIYYLTNGRCYKDISPPRLFKTTKDNPYNPLIYENTQEYFDQFKNEEDVVIEEENNTVEYWIFDKNQYKSQLNSELPVDDFFSWCRKAIERENKGFDIDNYFMLTSLIFEEDYEIQQDQENQNISFKTPQGELIVPRLRITKKENVSR